MDGAKVQLYTTGGHHGKPLLLKKGETLNEHHNSTAVQNVNALEEKCQ